MEESELRKTFLEKLFNNNTMVQNSQVALHNLLLIIRAELGIGNIFPKKTLKGKVFDSRSQSQEVTGPELS